MNIVLCESAQRRSFTAGNKARTDTVSILMECGFRHISLYTSKSNKALVFFQMITGIFRAVHAVKRNETIFIQYPYYPNIVNRVLISLLSLFRKIKGFRIGLLIHDSVGLRSAKNMQQLLRKEIKLIDTADYIICHNKKMVEMFRQNNGKGKYRVLGPFDYLYDASPAKQPDDNCCKIIIAGNLSKNKCSYLYQMEQASNYQINLYGVGYTGEQNDFIHYNGQYAPEDLIAHLEGQYGLLWDGDSCHTCTGDFGRYLKYNNPHKFSLYIAAGIPVIVWREAAVAEYVVKYNLGLCVDSLEEIDQIVSRMTNAEYEAMKQQVMNYRNEIIKGNHLKEAITN